MDGGDLVVVEVHGDLCGVVLLDVPPDRLHRLQLAGLLRTASGLSQVEGDAVCLLLRPQHVDVVRDEEEARAGHGRAVARHERGGAKVGLPLGLHDLVLQPLVLPSPDLLQLLAVASGRVGDRFLNTILNNEE